MNNFTKEQINKAMDALPYEIHKILFTPVIEQKVQKICFGVGFPTEQIITMDVLVNFAIMNLVPRGDFASVIKSEFSTTDEVTKALADGVSREIFASVEATEAQAKKEQELYEASKNEAMARAESAGLAPENLPTEEGAESFLPKLTPKIIMPSPATPEAVHPFEAKMKGSYPAEPQSMGERATESAQQNPPQENLGGQAIPQTFIPATPAPQAPKDPPVSMSGADPYREAIE